MKNCEKCGNPYGRRPHEAFWQFEARRFCSRPCASKARGQAKRVANSQFKARYRQVKTPDGRKMLEHRYVMEQIIGRRLKRWEQVHHRNHDRLDNRPENLELVSTQEHGERHTRHATVKKCAVCGAEFTPHKTKRVRQQTCSEVCTLKLQSKRTMHTECVICGTEFVGYPSRKTCSDRCRLERNRQTRHDRMMRGAGMMRPQQAELALRPLLARAFPVPAELGGAA